ncbi:MAG: methyltransferase domain-containing protein [Roseococcus sp.]|nr:methyltransferase domain-containing protein [Roseococcus sp.]
MPGQRSREAEWMDDPEAEGFDAALEGLERINRLSLAAQPVLRFLDRVAARHPGPLTILDVGAGGGDMLARIAAWAADRGVEVRLTGLDRSPASARHAAERGVPAEWITADLFEVSGSYDVVLCSLFAHHLEDVALVRFLRWLEARARLGWLISDLHRHWLPWGFVWGAVRLLRMPPMVVHDSTISIARGFTRADWRRLLGKAGVTAQIAWAFPFRWQVGVVRSPAPA